MLVLTAVFCALAAAQSRFLIGNIDGISYMSIGRQYAEGDIGDALNAYWSPAVSWLLAPLVAVGIDPVRAFLLINVAASTGTVALAALALRTATTRLLPLITVSGMLIPLLVATVDELTPDPLVITWVMGFVLTVVWAMRRFEQPSRRDALVVGCTLGVLAAAGYFVKLYLLPVAGVTLLALLVFGFLRRDARRRLLAAGGIAVAAWCIVVAPWVVAISAKYDTPTLGTSLAVNLANKFEASTTIRDMSLVLESPPNPAAVSFGEDRSPQSALAAADASTSTPLTTKLRYYLGERLRALPYYLDRLSSMSPLIVPTLVISVTLLAFGVARARRTPLVAAASITGLVYALGYAAITSANTSGGNVRYYWPIFACTVLVLGWAVHPVAGYLSHGRPTRHRVVAVILCVLAVGQSVLANGIGYGAPFSITSSPGPRPVALWGSPEPPHYVQLAAELDVVLQGEDVKIASNNYRTALRVAFLDDAAIYGRAGRGYDISRTVFQAALDAADIDYFLDFRPEAAPTAELPAESVYTSVAALHTLSACQDLAGAPEEACTITVYARATAAR